MGVLMCAKSDQSAQPEGPLAELFAQALQPGANAANAAPCPNAEQIAAYADQGLHTARREELEGHFAVCARCQSVLASLGEELPLVLSESPRVPHSVSASEKPREAGARWFWWLAPTWSIKL